MKTYTFEEMLKNFENNAKNMTYSEENENESSVWYVYTYQPDRDNKPYTWKSGISKDIEPTIDGIQDCVKCYSESKAKTKEKELLAERNQEAKYQRSWDETH